MSECLVLENPHATRQSLINLVVNNDARGWEVFYDTYRKLVYSVALKAGLSHTEAEEAMQETFITLSKTMPRFKYDPTKSFRSWLINTTQFKIKDQLRKRKRRNVSNPTSTREGRTSTLERVPDPASLDVGRIFEEEWRERLLELAVERVKQQVSASQYQIFDLYVLKKWPVGKIASTLGISAGRVYLAKYRIGQLVKDELALLKEQTL